VKGQTVSGEVAGSKPTIPEALGESLAAAFADRQRENRQQYERREPTWKQWPKK
jgi:hypothetical protein